MNEQASDKIPVLLSDLDQATRSLFIVPPPQSLYHYTTLDGAAGIIESRSLRLTKFSYLNDRRELFHAFDLFRQAIKEAMPTAPDATARNFLERAAKNISSFENTNICVASFCENGDLLSQWQAYGGGAGGGIALGFVAKNLQNMTAGLASGWGSLFKCVYDPPSQRLIVNNLVRLLLSAYAVALKGKAPEAQEKLGHQILGYFNTTFLRVAPVLKNNFFAAEREWRLVTLPIKNSDEHFRARVSSARVSVYYVLQFAPDKEGAFTFLHDIKLGPSPNSQHLSDAVMVLCKRSSVAWQQITTSQVPLRG